jgi:hypothetical protein
MLKKVLAIHVLHVICGYKDISWFLTEIAYNFYQLQIIIINLT